MTPPRSESIVRVPSRGVRLYPLATRLTFAAFAALGLWFDFGVIGVPPGDTGLFILGVGFPIGSMVLVDLLLEEYVSNRWIEISDTGVTAVYKFHRTFAPWTALTPLDSGYLGQSGFLFDRGKGRRTQLILTYEQMRAILACPQAPKWVFPQKVAENLRATPAP